MKQIIGIDWRPLILLLVRKWWMILLFGLLGLTIGLRESADMTTQYQATATIEWDRGYVEKLFMEGRLLRGVSEKPVKKEALARAVLGGDYSLLLEPIIEKLMTELNSLPVQKAVTDEIRKYAWGDATGRRGGEQPLLDMRMAIWGKHVAAPMLFVGPKFGTPLISLSASSSNEQVALVGLKAYLDVYRAYHLKTKRRKAEKALAWLRDELAEAREELERSRTDLLTFAKEHGVLLKSTMKPAAMEVLFSSTNRLARAREKQKTLSSDLHRITENPRTSAEALATKETLETLTEQLAQMEAEYFRLSGIYADSHPAVAGLVQRIEVLREEIRDKERASARTGRARAEAEASDALDNLKATRRDARKRAHVTPRLGLLSLRFQTNRHLYDMIFQEYKVAEQRAAGVTGSFRVVDPPSVYQYRGSRTRPVAKWLFFGLAVGAVSVVGLQTLRRILDSDHELDEAIGPKLLGIVPDLAPRTLFKQRSRRPETVEFLVHDRPAHPGADAIRNIQTSLQHSSSGTRLSTILVTSALPEEGKTFIAVSLATALSLQERSRVMVLDADMRRPRVHKVFGQETPSDGLSTVLTERGVKLSALVRPSQVRGLSYMTSGPIPTDPVAALSSERLQRLIEHLSRVFDHVIIDAPPVLGMPDSMLLARLVDGTVLVARDGLVTREEFVDGLNRITGVHGSRVAGVVQNRGSVQ